MTGASRFDVQVVADLLGEVDRLRGKLQLAAHARDLAGDAGGGSSVTRARTSFPAQSKDAAGRRSPRRSSQHEPHRARRRPRVELRARLPFQQIRQAPPLNLWPRLHVLQPLFLALLRVTHSPPTSPAARLHARPPPPCFTSVVTRNGEVPASRARARVSRRIGRAFAFVSSSRPFQRVGGVAGHHEWPARLASRIDSLLALQRQPRGVHRTECTAAATSGASTPPRPKGRDPTRDQRGLRPGVWWRGPPRSCQKAHARGKQNLRSSRPDLPQHVTTGFAEPVTDREASHGPGAGATRFPYPAVCSSGSTSSTIEAAPLASSERRPRPRA